MPAHTVVLIHGYSDRGESFRAWRRALHGAGFPTAVCSYESLVNEISINDIAEGFERALRIQAGLDGEQPFHAVVHSTGMLVIRAWLTNHARRRERLKSLVGLAPATFGSPLAHKGRSWLGAVFKGRKQLGPDFLESGHLVLDALELASRHTWDLAHRDLMGSKPFYGPSRTTPYVFVFCGNKAYSGLRRIIDSPGTDGTVRWAGCPLNARKVVLDLTDARGGGADRISVEPWSNAPSALVPVDGVDHTTILTRPPPALIDQVVGALRVASERQFDDWNRQAQRWSAPARRAMTEWQQFVVRAIDERGDPIPDYHLQLLTGDGKKLRPFDAEVHTNSGDPSLRAFHVNLDKLGASSDRLAVRIIASSGSALVGYRGFGSEKLPLDGAGSTPDGKWDAQVDVSTVIGNDKVRFFFPFTTTLLELRLDREPLPLSGPNQVTRFL